MINLIFRVFLIAAGLVFAVSVAVAFVLMVSIWALRAAWAKLTGRPATPFIFRADPRTGFERMYRRAEGSRTPRADAVRPARPSGGVTDVEYREPGA